jgi:hypothetical protein
VPHALHGSAVDDALIGLVLGQREQRFVVRPEDGHIGYLRLRLPADLAARPSVETIVEMAAADCLELDVRYLGLLSFREVGARHELVALALLRSPVSRSALSARHLGTMTLEEMRRSVIPVERLELFETANRWLMVEQDARGLTTSIERAFTLALDLLTECVSLEDGLRGWSQYLDGQTVGSLSTAQGLLAHVHAGRRGPIVEEAAATLEAIQNPDGGWQVRRALVGRPSELSITESTCYSVWALSEVGRTASSPVLQRGLDWLERSQRPNGGWQASARSGETQVSATSAAVRTLARFDRREAVTRGTEWLLQAQCPDGGWGTLTCRGGQSTGSTAAHTAHAVIALLAAGVPRDDAAVRSGCQYLERTFDPSRDEPWPSAQDNVLVDDATSSRMFFRHFATPWALAALSLAGYDLGDPTVFVATTRLLQLQEPSGAWPSKYVTPRTYPTWTVHDALFALRTVLRCSGRNLAPVALARCCDEERRLMQAAVVRLLADRAPARSLRARRRERMQTLWLSGLTVAVSLLVASQLGLLQGLVSPSGAGKVAAAALTALIAGLGATIPTLAVEEYRSWRARADRREREQTSEA